MIVLDEKTKNIIDVEVQNLEFIGKTVTTPVVIEYHYGIVNNIGHMLTTIKIHDHNRVVNSQTTIDSLRTIPERRKKLFIRSLLDEFESLQTL